MNKLNEINLLPTLYSRFKDDMLVATKTVEKGSRYVGGKLEINEEQKETDADRDETDITIEIVKEIGESIDTTIKLTVDAPKNYNDGKMPVLDITVKVNKEENNRIDFEFFEKKTKNPRVILSNSAINFKSKRTILTQECLRRIRNTKRELGEEIRNKHLNKFMLILKQCGYGQKFRKEVLDSALSAFEKMEEEDKNGIKPLYRSAQWEKLERIERKNHKKLNWWRSTKGQVDYNSLLFVPPTPGGELLKELEKREIELNKNSDDRIKMIETGGIKMETMLSNKNPFKRKKCEEKVCPLCQTDKNEKSERVIPCNTNNVGYQWICETCEKRNITKIYEGETSRSARIRGKEHVNDLEKKNEKSALYKHKVLEHSDENVKYRMEITGIFKDALTRQANESVRIQQRKPLETLNSKCEFNSAPVARITVEKSNFGPRRVEQGPRVQFKKN